MIDTVLYDFDGTIMDTNAVILASWKHTFKTIRNVDVTPEFVYSTFGEPLESTMARFFPEMPVEDAIAVYRDFHYKHFSEMIDLFPGTRETLEELRRRGYTTALVTSRLKRTTYIGLEKFDLFKYFDAVVTVDDTHKYKPDPEPALAALRKVGSDPENAVMVGDSRFDMLCAHNAGVMPVLVDWSVSMDADAIPDDIPVAHVLHRQEDIFDILEKEA